MAPKRGSCVEKQPHRQPAPGLDSRSHGPQLGWEAFLPPITPGACVALFAALRILPFATLHSLAVASPEELAFRLAAPGPLLGPSERLPLIPGIAAPADCLSLASGRVILARRTAGSTAHPHQASCAAPRGPGWQRGTSLGQGPTQPNFAESRREPGWLGLDVWALLSSGNGGRNQQPHLTRDQSIWGKS